MASKTFLGSNYTTLALADAAAAAAGGLLILDTSVTLTVDLTLTAPRVQGGGGIVTLAGFTLTLQGMVDGTGQMFDASGGGTVSLAEGSSVNIRWFGATGSGSDDTRAFSAALASVERLAQGGELFVPPGVYPIKGDGIRVFPAAFAGLTIRGAGRRSSLFQSHVTSGPMLSIGDPSGRRATDGVTLVDIGFETHAGPADTIGETALVHLNFCRDARVTRCSFLGGFATQLLIARPQGFTVRDTDFHGERRRNPPVHIASTGIVLAPGNDTAPNAQNAGQAGRIECCTIRDFRNASGTSTAVDILVGCGSEFAIVDCDIENNDCSINCDTSRNQVVRNSFETAVVAHAIGVAAARSGVSNVGKGVLRPDATTPLLAGAQAGAYRIRCTAIGTNGGTFTVTDPSGASLGTVIVGATFSNQIKFVISDGAPDFAVSDAFTFNVVDVPAATAVAAPTNMGDGTIAMDVSTPVLAGGQIGAYGVRCTAEAAGGGTFTVLDPYNVTLGTVSVGSTFSAAQIRFSIQAGVNDFRLGDYFTINVSSTPTIASTCFSSSHVVVTGANVGTGTITVDVATPTLAGVQHGTYLARCTTSAPNGGTFTVTDPKGTPLGTVFVGATFSAQVKFVIHAGATDFALDDTFQINAIGDVMVKVGQNATVTSNSFLHNTMSSDGINNLRFFDLYSYRETSIDYNVFITANGYAVYLGPDAGNKTSHFRFNDRINPRTQILYGALRGVPASNNWVDGKWWIEGCNEGSVTTARDSAPASAATPSVANLAEIATKNTSATTITSFLDGHLGQMLIVYFGDGNTTLKHGAGIFLLEKQDKLFPLGTWLLFVATLSADANSTPVWQEVCRLPRDLTG